MQIYMSVLVRKLVFIIIIISISKEDNIFIMTASLPCGPPMNTNNDYY